MRKQPKLEMVVKCVNCGETRTITAEEARSVEGPVCGKCYSPMIVKQAKVKP